MTMNNKILTVSYGTFSCTLEGFDDSFGTMKAIAEYFRDLASDDRYFGAEPPQPDAEMLTRIAEREISRRVEARQHDGRIVLSASQAQPADALPAAATAAAVATAQLSEDTAEDAATEDTGTEHTATADAENAVAPAQDIPQEPAPVAPMVSEPEADAAPLVSGSQEDAPEAVAPVEDSVHVAEEPEEPSVADHDDHDDHDDDVAPVDLDASADQEAFFASAEDDIDPIDSMADASEEDAVAEPVAPAPQDAPANSIAAKLQRIRAVVSRSQQDAAEDELFEDEHAEDMAAPAAASVMSDDYAMAQSSDDDAMEDDDAASQDVIADAARDIEDAFQADDALADAEEEAAQDDGDDVAAVLARFDAEATADDATGDDAQPAQDDDDMGLDSLAALMAADDAAPDASDDDDNLFDASDEDEDEEAAQAPRRARVIKVKRADIDAALASGQLEQVDAGDEAAQDESATSLSDQEEAELLAELAQVEAELPAREDDAADPAQDASDGDVDAEIAAEAEDQDEDETAAMADEEDESAIGMADGSDIGDAEQDDAATDIAATSAEPQARDVQDDDVSRLMAEAENQMEEPEGSNRRDAFAHLKAAVKAKKADAAIGNDSIKDEGAFRSDLAEVVKPRRPEVNASRSDRPESARPAPLKLVAEQRVDVDVDMAAKGPVRPRRVAAAQDVGHDTQDAESFAEYVAELGAHDLPALLEAAASYLSFVEGRDQFSRPQLMTKVRQVEQEEFSREDGLRSFGQLLRSGKIEKISGGRFAVTSDIGYRPEQRAAG